MSAQKNYLLVPLRLLALVFWVTLLPVLFLLARMLKISAYRELPHLFHRGMCFILGISVNIEGDQCEEVPTLYISNHISYLDILVLGHLRAYFIAKSEIANWPVFGTLAKFQNTLFIERRRSNARRQLEVMQKHLRQPNSLILFPEGTSTNGWEVLRFKSSLLQAADLGEDEPRVAIQPVTLAYTHQAGNKMTREVLDYYAWYADMSFGSHAVKLLPLKKVDVKVCFHPVCYLDQFETRKHCADYCQKLVADKLNYYITVA